MPDTVTALASSFCRAASGALGASWAVLAPENIGPVSSAATAAALNRIIRAILPPHRVE
jgi:hypothetical protein